MPAATAMATSASEVTLDYWYGWGGGIGDACKALAQRYSEAHTNIKFNTLQHDWKGEKLLTAFAGGTPPDVFEWGFPSEFGARGVLRAMDDLLEASSVISKDNLPSVMLSSANWRGKLVGMPAMDFFTEQALTINPVVVQSADLDPTKPPQTLDELRTWADQLTKKSDNTVTQIGIDPLGSVFSWPHNWLNAYGMQAYDSDKEAFVWDVGKMAQAFTWIGDYSKQWGADNLAAFRKSFGGWYEPTSSACQNKEALQVQGYWYIGIAKQNCPSVKFTYDWSPVSADRKGKKFQRLAGHFALMPKQSTKTADAWGFTEFMTTDDAQQIMFDTGGTFVATKSWLKKIDTSNYPGLDWYVKSVDAADEMYGREPVPTNEWQDLWYKARDAVVYGEKTPDQAADEWDKQAKASLAKALQSAKD
jgi:ABC-type glycerol-3-phosphate transport system substrate-binding protein